MNQLYIYVYALLLGPTSHHLPHSTTLGHDRAPSWAPCAIKQLPTSYLFYTWYVYIYINATLWICLTLSFLPYVHMSVFYVWVYSCLASRLICTAFLDSMKWSESHSVVSNSLQPHGLHSPWSFPGQNTRAGSHSLLQRILPTQGSNLGLPRASRFFTSWATRETPYTCVNIWYCFSLSDLLYSICQTLGASTSLQMTQFCSLLT